MTTVLENTKLDFDDVLLVPKRSDISSREDIILERNFKFKYSPYHINCVPIIAANMDNIGTHKVANVFDNYAMRVAFSKFIEIGANYYPHFKSIGISGELPNLHPYAYICIDAANGYTTRFADYVSQVRYKYPDKVIMAGNVVTPDMVYHLIEKGADIVKIGIGPGSVCTTRKVTGVGYPQFSAILECVDAAHGAGGHICSDGGIKTPGDFAKAFGAGADFVMAGGIFAGTDETGTELYGMASEAARKLHYDHPGAYRAAEGKVVRVTPKGPLKNVVEEILGGLRSAGTYIGAKCIKDFPKCATFVRVNNTHNTLYGN